MRLVFISSVIATTELRITSAVKASTWVDISWSVSLFIFSEALAIPLLNFAPNLSRVRFPHLAWDGATGREFPPGPVLHPEVQKRYGHVIAIFIRIEEVENP